MSLSDADFGVFFDPRDFGTSARYTPGLTGQPHDLTGIFTDRHEVVLSGGGSGIATTGPVLVVAETDLPPGPLGQDDILEIGVTRYRVAEMQPDGTGLTRLVLELE